MTCLSTLLWLEVNFLVEPFPQCTLYIYILIYIKGSKLLQTAVYILGTESLNQSINRYVVLKNSCSCLFNPVSKLVLFKTTSVQYFHWQQCQNTFSVSLVFSIYVPSTFTSAVSRIDSFQIMQDTSQRGRLAHNSFAPKCSSRHFIFHRKCISFE